MTAATEESTASGAPVTPGLPLITFASIMREPLPPIEWDVEGLIAHAERVLIYAEWGALKTWLGLDLGLHLGTGGKWLDEFTIPQARRVLYIDEEMNERTLRRRIKRLGAGMALATDDLPFRALSRFGVVFDDAGAARLLKALHDAGFTPEVIIIDTYRRVNPGDENETKDVAKFWKRVEPILKARITLIVIHHMRKPRSRNEGHRHRASGSTDITAGADATFALSRDQQDRNTIRVTCEKTREAEEVSPFIVTLRDDGDRDGPVVLQYGGTEKEFVAEGRKVADWIPAVEELLRTQGTASTGAILDALKARGCPQRTGQRTLGVIGKGHERIERVSRGVWRLKGEANAA